ncbi:PREDICTED: long-chain specific acyl-CoA dehydrogenase, mitochondrial [Dipodomys ordii]|uniref:Long-chain specific acyl-CoA dehydrogenase, mitochondrial n=1 Tax=Dipodomys ordii TaxID=10020 RepID=A0A1S3F790_DIPOR|nr:PREDICTED: long-chain specific acyl-CoA dehydrogenase, mitochondrial [Dipodomys ordii]
MPSDVLSPFTGCSHSGGEDRLETSSAKKLTDIGIRRIFSSEHDIFRESVRKFFQEEVIPYHSEWEKAGEVSRELWEKAGKQGLLGINIAEKHGGIGGDLFSTALTWEEQAYSNCTGPGFSLHSDIVMPYIANYGSKEQIEHFIPRMTEGKCIGAIAMTEPGAGSDLQGVRTNAKKDGSDWILNGSKVFITNGWLSDVVIVVAVTNREARSPAHGISLFLVEDGMKGFIKGRKLHKMGLKAQDTAELFFEDVRLPAGALLGEENKGFYYLMQELPQERLLIADIAISACEFMFEETRNYVKQRKAFGKTVAHIQTVQHKLAELKTHICVTRAFVDSCLQLHEKKRLDSATASMAKYWASELQNSVAYECVQLHGGWGYMWEYPIAKQVNTHVSKNGALPFSLFMLDLQVSYVYCLLHFSLEIRILLMNVNRENIPSNDFMALQFNEVKINPGDSQACWRWNPEGPPPWARPSAPSVLYTPQFTSFTLTDLFSFTDVEQKTNQNNDKTNHLGVGGPEAPGWGGGAARWARGGWARCGTYGGFPCSPANYRPGTPAADGPRAPGATPPTFAGCTRLARAAPDALFIRVKSHTDPDPVRTKMQRAGGRAGRSGVSGRPAAPGPHSGPPSRFTFSCHRATRPYVCRRGIFSRLAPGRRRKGMPEAGGTQREGSSP